MGDGSNVLFKKDHCFGNGSVRQSYPELFKIAAHGDAFVFDYVDLVSGSLQWKPLFNREAQNWELESLDHFFNDLYAVNIPLLGNDHLVWLPSLSKAFQVRTFYSALLLRNRQSTPSLGRVSGKLESFLELRFSFGLLHLVKSQLLIILVGGKL